MENKSIVAAVMVIIFLAGILFLTNRPVENSRAVTPTNNSTLTELGKETLTSGTGDREVRTGDTISVHYTGTLANGTKFDSSKDRGTPFEFTVGQGVIEGWSEGVLGMKQGEVRKLSIPSSLGYGARAAGSIPANSDLYFEIELLEFK
jgi:FKBP-type peptidyl-prolyl cis-trans isomerase FkpA